MIASYLQIVAQVASEHRLVLFYKSCKAAKIATEGVLCDAASPYYLGTTVSTAGHCYDIIGVGGIWLERTELLLKADWP